MSKTITIPTNCNPYIVVINNNVYTYKAGDTIEVPDEVAEAIEDAIELVPKPKRYLSKFAQRVDGSLEEITVEDLEGITSIYPYAFYYIKGIKGITFPNSVKSIDNHAFYGCDKLESVKMSNNVSNIGADAFNWSTRLAKVYLPEIPPALANVNAFNNIKADCVFYCKTQASLDAYKAAANWSTLTGTYSFVVEE